MEQTEARAAANAATSLHPEAAIRIARALSAITVEIEQVMFEEIDRLAEARDKLGPQATGAAQESFAAAVEMIAKDGRLLGYPLIHEIAASLQSILASVRAEALPLDILDAHIDVMRAVLTDRTLSKDSAATLVADLSAAAADYVASRA